MKLPHKCKARSPSFLVGGRGVFRDDTMQQASQFLHKARARRQLNSISRRESEILLPSLLWFDFIAVRVVRAVRWRGCLFLSFDVLYLALLGTTASITQICAFGYAACHEFKVLKCRKRVCSPRSSRRKRLAATKRPDCRVEPRFAREEHKRCEIKFNKIIANFDHLIIFRFFFRAMELPEHLW